METGIEMRTRTGMQQTTQMKWEDVEAGAYEPVWQREFNTQGRGHGTAQGTFSCLTAVSVSEAGTHAFGLNSAHCWWIRVDENTTGARKGGAHRTADIISRPSHTILYTVRAECAVALECVN